MHSISADRYFDLGGHTRRVTTCSREAQYWFNHGLNWCFGFNQEEGLKCFHKALQFDSQCAMAHWGAAYAAGPFYNLPWRDFGESERVDCTRLCYDHVRSGTELISGVSPEEAGLLKALSQRFQVDHPVSPGEFDHWDDDYANAMRALYREFPEDLDIAALFVEAMITRTPWKLWDVRADQPCEKADTLESVEVLEQAMSLADQKGMPQHPAILHLHIHALEMSATPERALKSCEGLGALCPEAGHMNHMPGHIYVICGMYEEAKTASEKAIRADRLYRNYAGDDNFYTTARCHDLHLMMYACMFLGQFGPALAAAEEMCEALTPELIALPDRPQMTTTLEGYHSTKVHVLVRFGRWQNIIDSEMPGHTELYLASIPMWHYARGIAYAALGRFPQADREYDQFLAASGRVPVERKIFNNPVVDILAVAEQMMLGEIEYHKGNHEIGYHHLRQSVVLDDNLAYSEPWPWMHPPRHALGALLLEQGHVEEAEHVYRTDLGLNDELYRCARHPGNIWALHGLAEILGSRGESGERVEITRQLEAIRAKSDQDISSSCCCRKQVVLTD